MEGEGGGEFAVEIACARSGKGRREVEAAVRGGRFATVGEVVGWARGGYLVHRGEAWEVQGDKHAPMEPAALMERWEAMGLQLGGLAEARRVLKRVLLWRRTRAQTFARLGMKPANGVLLYGCPGTGKTALVRQTAAATGFEVVAVDAAMLARGEVGASERELKKAFERARKSAPSVVFLDEIDALFATARAGAPQLLRLVAALSLLLDGVGGMVVVVGATNQPWMVSKALLRSGRFEHCIEVGLPDKEERREIATVYAVKMKLGDVEKQFLMDVAEGDVAKGFSGADIAGACRRAAMSALARDSRIERVDIERAFQTTQPSVKRSDALEVESWRPP